MLFVMFVHGDVKTASYIVKLTAVMMHCTSRLRVARYFDSSPGPCHDYPAGSSVPLSARSLCCGVCSLSCVPARLAVDVANVGAMSPTPISGATLEPGQSVFSPA